MESVETKKKAPSIQDATVFRRLDEQTSEMLDTKQLAYVLSVDVGTVRKYAEKGVYTSEQSDLGRRMHFFRKSVFIEEYKRKNGLD